jgi:predicted RNA binding protein YcfA (HicA-like mRNA interferase family)
LKALQRFGFELVREGNHISLARTNPDGTRTPLTMPNHRLIKASTLRLILRQSEISREDFLAAYEEG